MNRVSISNIKDNFQLDELITVIKKGRYFKKISKTLLRKVTKQADLLYLKKDEYLIREGDTAAPEMYILIEGSLAVISRSKFILRLDLSGDIVGEMSVISNAPRSADVLAENETKLIAFSNKVFEVNETAEKVPFFYFMFSHLLAEKLRITTAQSLIRKNERVLSSDEINVAMVDENETDRMILKGIIESQWPECVIKEFSSPQNFISNPPDDKFDFIVVDASFSHDFKTQEEAIRQLFNTLSVFCCPILITSALCNDPVQRTWLMEFNPEEQLGKPFSVFDVKHVIVKFRIWHYKQKELDKIERDADTDRLTGMANRRRFDEFLEALMTIFPENNNPFSMIMSDVDNFKHYNDTHGHQMGDVVLAGVAAIISQNVRRGDLAARFGGEEFVVVLPNCPKKSSYTSSRETSTKNSGREISLSGTTTNR